MSRLSSSNRDSIDGAAKAMDGIHVSVRIRPLSSTELSSGIQSCCSATSTSSLIINKPGDSGAYLKSQASSAFEFAFDAVFDENASQLEVYNKSAKPYVAKTIQGENVTIFAYGATGAGKTHTMFGNTRFDSTAAFAGAGIIPQAVADLFRLLNGRIESADKGESWTVAMSYMEVYNEQVCDLLEPVNKNLPLREDPDRGVVIVAGLSEFKVTSYDEVLELLMKGQVNRKTEATKANIVSSRSHAILQFSVTHTKRAGASSNSIIESKLSLIDLAGSERASATQNSGVRLQESANINKSLLALANCINALSERSNAACSSTPRKATKKTNVKYRDSKLTHLLKGSLEGNCNLVMIANVNPSDSTHDDTYRTLNYANRAKNMKVKPTTREIGAETTLAERELRLKEENEELRMRLAKLEENAQHSADSEQQLLQALAQALDALNAAKAESAVVDVIGERCNHHSHPSLASPTPTKTSAATPGSIMVPATPSKLCSATPSRTKSPVPSSLLNSSPSPKKLMSPVPLPQQDVTESTLDSLRSYHNRESTGSVASIAPTFGEVGKKSKRDSACSALSCSPELTRYNTRSTAGSIVYSYDGESYAELEDADEAEEQEHTGNKSRRTSVESSPRGRSSDASTQSMCGRPSTARLSGPYAQSNNSSSAASASRNAAKAPRPSAGSTRGGSIGSVASAVGANSKPGRLSNDLVKKYEVLANVTHSTNKADSNASNTAKTGPTTRSAELTKTSTAMEVDTVDKPARPSFGKITIDPRFQYGHGAAAPYSPPKGFFSRFLCGLNKKR